MHFFGYGECNEQFNHTNIQKSSIQNHYVSILSSNRFSEMASIIQAQGNHTKYGTIFIQKFLLLVSHIGKTCMRLNMIFF